jgi:hypothetical protein
MCDDPECERDRRDGVWMDLIATATLQRISTTQSDEIETGGTENDWDGPNSRRDETIVSMVIESGNVASIRAAG